MIQTKKTDTNGYGKVTLVGFGPGNPELLTIAGEKALLNADIIFHDNLVHRTYLESLNKKLVDVGKRSGHHSKEQEEINRLLLKAATEGKNVVRVKGGDPMIFAHGGGRSTFSGKPSGGSRSNSRSHNSLCPGGFRQSEPDSPGNCLFRSLCFRTFQKPADTRCRYPGVLYESKPSETNSP